MSPEDLSKPGFQSMLFLTPPKIDSMSPPIQSPLLEVMDNLNSLLQEEEEGKIILLDKELLKLLDGTPQQQKDMLANKWFEPKKSGRNITATLLDH